MAVSQLAYVGIGVSDMGRWKAFASDLLGLHDRGGRWGHKVQLEPSPRPATVAAGR